MNRWAEAMRRGEPLLGDGGMGTALFAAGLPLGSAPERLNLSESGQRQVRVVHRAFRNAGADLILTNSFGGNPVRLAAAGLREMLIEVNRNAVRLAREIAGNGIVGGSMGPMGLRVGPDGALSLSAARDGFAAQAAALAAGGVDLLWIETMSDPHEVRAAVEGARSAAPALPIVVTLTFSAARRTYAGLHAGEAMVMLRGLGVAAAGANCGDSPEAVVQALRDMHPYADGMPLVAKLNAGTPYVRDQELIYPLAPWELASYTQAARASGAWLVGGCCGVTPRHLPAMRGALMGKPTL